MEELVSFVTYVMARAADFRLSQSSDRRFGSGEARSGDTPSEGRGRDIRGPVHVAYDSNIGWTGRDKTRSGSILLAVKAGAQRFDRPILKSNGLANRELLAAEMEVLQVYQTTEELAVGVSGE